MPTETQKLPVWLWLVLIAVGVLAVTMGARQSLGLFVSPLNTGTGLGIANISLAMTVGQFMWGAVQPEVGAISDHYGPGWVLAAGVMLFMYSTLGLSLVLGMLMACGSGRHHTGGAAGDTIVAAACRRTWQAAGGSGYAGRSARLRGIASYLLLHAGFFTCGVHIVFLVPHLPGEVNLCGVPARPISYCYTWLGSHWPAIASLCVPACNGMGLFTIAMLGRQMWLSV